MKDEDQCFSTPYCLGGWWGECRCAGNGGDAGECTINHSRVGEAPVMKKEGISDVLECETSS